MTSMTARRKHAAKRRLRDNIAQRLDELSLERPGMAPQQHGTCGHVFARGPRIRHSSKQIYRQGVVWNAD
jgi:hypothetical protein